MEPLRDVTRPTSDPLAATVDALGDMDPAVTARLVDWLKNYDPSDGVHEIGHGEAPYSVEDTVAFIDACHASWKKLVENGKENARHYGYSLPKPGDYGHIYA